MFKNNCLSITVKSNLKATDSVDIHFDLVKEIYKVSNQEIQSCTINTARTSKNGSQKEFQIFQMNLFLTNQFVVTNLP